MTAATALMIIVAIGFIGWAMIASLNNVKDDSGIVFKEPRINRPGHRLGEYRRKRAMVEVDKPEGNEVDWVAVRRARQSKCDHLYWPVEELGVLVGQKCALCGLFHSADEVLNRLAPMRQPLALVETDHQP